MSTTPDDGPSSRRAFLRGFASSPVRIVRGVAGKIITAKETRSEVKEEPLPTAAPKFQFTLATLMGITTAVCLWLGLLGTNADSIVFLGAVAIAVVIEFIRGRFRTTSDMTLRNRINDWLNAVAGGLCGAVVGVIFGILLRLFIPMSFGFWEAGRAGGSLGIILGSMFPRIARGLFYVLGNLPSIG